METFPSFELINFLKTISRQFEYELLKAKVTTFLQEGKEKIHRANEKFSSNAEPSTTASKSSSSRASNAHAKQDTFFSHSTFQTFGNKMIEEVIPETHESQEYSKHSDEGAKSQSLKQGLQELIQETPEFGLFKTRLTAEEKAPTAAISGNPFITKTNLPPLPYEEALQRQVQ